jgi:hypothetical protein
MMKAGLSIVQWRHGHYPVAPIGYGLSRNKKSRGPSIPCHYKRDVRVLYIQFGNYNYYSGNLDTKMVAA